MTSSAQFNALPLLAVKPALDSALDKIGGTLEQFFADSGENKDALQEAVNELHRTYGVLRMLSLDGVIVFCGELEKLLREFASGSLQPSSMHQDIIQRALLILTHYLNSLANGAPNAALRLFDPYQELLQARGIEVAFEVDLFFPELNIELPPTVLNAPLAADAHARIKVARSQYQQALLKWLRQHNTAEALLAMRAAVQAVMTCVPQSKRRALWWVASGLLDCLIYDGLPPELNAKKLLGRIDLQMKALVEGTQTDERAILTEMLYLVARSHAVSDAVDEIKRRYALDEYLPEEPPLPPAETVRILEQMRTQLNEAEETWEKCLQDAAACKPFSEQAERLYTLSERLDRNTLQLLCKQIHTAAMHAEDAEYRRHIAMNVAMALMLLDRGIAHYTYLGDNFHEQVRILGQGLQAGAEALAGQEAEQLMRLHCQMAQREIFPLLADAMSNNLQHVEQELNAFFSNPEKREELPQLVRLLNQVQGSLHMLSLDVAEQLMRNAKATVGRYAEGGKPVPAEMRSVASAVSAVGAYIHDLTYGQKPDSTPLEQVLQEMNTRPPAIAPAAEKAVAPSTVAVQALHAEDNEMLEVFLEEAQEVLKILRANLDLSQLHPDSDEPLVTIRRGFHTLKGSGRMVGLNDFGEVAWAVERAMNKWLQEKQPATPGLLQFIADAEALFHAWVDSLRSHSGTVLDPAALIAAAQEIESGKKPVAATTPLPPQALGPHAPERETIAPELGTIPAALGKSAMEISFESLALPPIEETQATKPAPAIAEFVLPDLEEVSPRAAPAPEEKPFETLSFESLTLPPVEETQGAKPVPTITEFALPDWEDVLPREATAPVPVETPSVEFPTPTEEPQADTVTIGTITLSASLFNIATEESANNLTKLQNCFAELRASTPPAISYDFMRAAHTLAGVNRTMGFTSVADLSHALELWLEARIGKSFMLSDEQTAVVEQSIAMLDAMFLDICNHQTPLAQPELIARLQADQESLIAGEPAGAQTSAARPERQAKPAEAEKLTTPAQINEVSWGEPPSPHLLSIPKSAAPAQETAGPTAAVPQALVTPAHAAEIIPVKPSQEAAQAGAQPETAQSAEESGVRIRRYVEERAVRDETDEQLLPIFLEESNDLQPKIGDCLRAWRKNPADGKPAADLQRVLHTLKGSARMAGVMRLGELVHRMEDRVVAAIKGKQDDALWDILDNYSDRIGNALERLRGGAMDTEAAETPTAEAQAPLAMAPVVEIEPHKPETPAERMAAMLRVRSDTVDRLVNEAGEISVARSRIETELRAFKTGMADMAESVGRLRKQLREIEIQAESQLEARIALAQDVAEKFDPLEFDRFTRFQELTRFMNESVHDVQTVQQALLKNLDEVASAMSAQAYLNRDLQQSLMAIRMVPFSGISNRLYRVVRQTAKELNKRALLDIQGGEVELDRSILDRMTAPFEHLLRNAVAHGLESQDERSRSGKQPIGQIHVSLAQESNEVVFEVSDDGAGINLDRLRQKALQLGLAQAGASISGEDAMLLIFNTGISTATEVTEISGRGIGLDVVRNEIVSLGGQISVQSKRGQGTRFTIRLPLTLAVAQILMIRAGQEHHAIPSGMVEQVLHIKPEALEAAYLAGQVIWHGASYPLRYLPRLLGNEKQQPESRLHNPVLLLHSGEQRMALHVDELFGNQETVVKNIGPQLSRQPGIAGATVLGSGRVVLILNPIALTQRIIVSSKTEPATPVKAAEPAAAAAPHMVPVIMVVDDSLTVRKVTSRMLTRAGYEVVTAKDGVDALEQLTQITPDVMLLDVEMPRMDGFELTKQIRRDPKLHTLPILMITSRTAEKHRDYALELGVNAYFGKPFQEEELLQQIASFINRPA
jgi:chemosensory pili system protein ChpA (sensor histidine kinase/response regulator)